MTITSTTVAKGTAARASPVSLARRSLNGSTSHIVRIRAARCEPFPDAPPLGDDARGHRHDDAVHRRLVNDLCHSGAASFKCDKRAGVERNPHYRFAAGLLGYRVDSLPSTRASAPFTSGFLTVMSICLECVARVSAAFAAVRPKRASFSSNAACGPVSHSARIASASSGVGTPS